MWLLVWVTFHADYGLIEKSNLEVFTTHYQCEDARWTIEMSKSIDSTREALACIEIKKDE